MPIRTMLVPASDRLERVYPLTDDGSRFLKYHHLSDSVAIVEMVDPHGHILPLRDIALDVYDSEELVPAKVHIGEHVCVLYIQTAGRGSGRPHRVCVGGEEVLRVTPHAYVDVDPRGSVARRMG